jgi:multiple sugar transport system substrate-binding protein
VFNRKQYDLANTWIKAFINVPLGQMKPFLTDVFNQQLIPEPAASTQSVYNALNPVVEAVLTDRNADIPTLLKQANSVAQQAISNGS